MIKYTFDSYHSRVLTHDTPKNLAIKKQRLVANVSSISGVWISFKQSTQNTTTNMRYCNRGRFYFFVLLIAFLLHEWSMRKSPDPFTASAANKSKKRVRKSVWLRETSLLVPSGPILLNHVANGHVF